MHKFGTRPTITPEQRAQWTANRPTGLNRSLIWNQQTALIERLGQTLIGVGGDENTPPFAYTVSGGVYPYELITTSLPVQHLEAILNGARQELVAKGVESIAPGERFMLTETTNMPTAVQHAPENIASGATSARRRTPGVPIYQLVWPDPAGLFPWDAGVDPKMAWQQGYGDGSLRL